MTDETKDPASKGVAGTALGLGIAGTVGTVLSLLGGGFAPQVAGGPQSATYELAKKDSEIALLNAKLETRQEVSEVYAALRARDREQDAKTAALEGRVLAIETAAPLREQLVLQKVECLSRSVAQGFKNVDCALGSLSATISAITQTVVPKSAICPEVMTRYNSWTSPASSDSEG